MTASEDQPRRLTRHGADRRQELRAHAEALFIERGFENTRMVDVAQSAGVAKGLAYWYFDSKESLFREIIADARVRLRRSMADATAALEDDPLAQLYVGTFEAVRFVAEHHRLFTLIHTVSGFGDAHVAAANKHASETARVIRRGQRLEQIRTDDDALLLAHFNAGVVNQAIVAFTTGARVTKVSHAAARYVVAALAASNLQAERVIREHGKAARRVR